jgi:hypothetical protein
MQSGKLLRRATIQGLLGLALAAGVLAAPAATHAQKQGTGPSQISLAVEPQADTASRTDGVDTYKVLIVNRTGGTVEDIALSVPFEAGYSLAGATFNQDDAWVAQVGGSSARIQVEQLRGIGDTLVATLRFTGPRDAAAGALSNRISANWDRNGEQYTIFSNQPGVTSTALTANRTGQSRIAFSGGAFASNEPVTFWYTAANGVSVPLVVDNGVLIQKPAKSDNDDEEKKYGEFLAANDQGATNAVVSIAGLPAGSYTLAARGNWTGVTASAPFIVQ